MGAASSYLQNKIVDDLFRARAYSKPSQLWIGLITTAPANDGAAEVEFNGTGYARATPGVNGYANWIETQRTPGTAGTNVDSSATVGRTANGAIIDFGTVGAGGWGSAVGWAVYDAASAGNRLFYFAFASPITFSEGAQASFPVGQLTITLD